MPATRCHLVTGALGFAGLHLVDRLLSDGIPVCGLGRHGPDEPLPDIAGPFVQEGPDATLAGGVRFTGPAGSWVYAPCALEEPGAVPGHLERVRPEAIYHLAAQSSAALSFSAPLETFRSNVLGALNLLEAVRSLPAEERPRVLAVGSAEEYGTVAAADGPIAEDRPCRPVSPYGASKLAQTELCRQYQRAFALPVIVARPFSHTGPGQPPRFALASFAAQIAAAEARGEAGELVVGDLSPTRDYVDVRDVVRAYRLLVARGEPGVVYNVAAGRSLTLADALAILLRDARVELSVRPDPSRFRPADIPYLVGDATRLSESTGWQPEHPLADTLAELLQRARKERRG
jgi:GDP-4-dehydro-6-deoxy-D-mannose reductase